MKPIPIILLMVTTCSLFFSCNGESPSRKQDNNTDEAFPRISEASAVTLDGSDSKSSSSMLLFSDEDITDSNSSLEDFVMQKKIPEMEEERKERTATQSPTFQLPKESEEPIRQDTLRDILLSRIESINQILPDQKNFSNSFDKTNPEACFKACVLGESDYRSGDRITLRVMEGITLNGISIRKHDILEGYCSIQGDRLQIAVHRVKGKPLSLNAYDTDGMKGL